MTDTFRRLALAGLALGTLTACDDSTTVAGAGPVSGVEGACLTATADGTGVGGLSVLRTEQSDAAASVYIDVPGAVALPRILRRQRAGSALHRQRRLPLTD